MIKRIKITNDSQPGYLQEEIVSILKEIEATHSVTETDGQTVITYDLDYVPVEIAGRKANKEANALSKNVVQYATALFKKQPQLPAGYNNGRIQGPKTEWSFEECVNEAVVVMYKERAGFTEPLIVSTHDVDIQPVWNSTNNYMRNLGL
jgi:hypothetical protein